MVKRIIQISALSLLGVLAVLTFVSRTIYNRNLPRVSAVGIVAGFVPLTEDTAGTLVFPDEIALAAAGAWLVAEALVGEGDAVERGDALVRFDTRAHDLELRVLELDIQRLEDAVSHGVRFADAELQLARERLSLFAEASPPDVLVSPMAGFVFGLNAAAGRVTEPGSIVLTVLPDADPLLRFMLPLELVNDLENMAIMSRLETNYGTLNVAAKLTDFQWEGESVEFYAAFDAFAGRAVPRQRVPLRLEQRGAVQSHVVPRDAVFQVGNNQHVVYAIESRPGLFGPEDYLVAISVIIIQDNGRLASILSMDDIGEENGVSRLQGLTVARDISGWVSPGDVVWVRER
jgi:biotin carboxyl carrier protein